MLDRLYHPLLESRMGTFSFRTCMSSQTQSSAQAQVRWIQSMLQTNWEHNVESIMNSDNCKHRNDTARDTINIEWHVCFGNTSFQLIQSSNVCRRAGTNPRVFQTRPVLRACSTTSPIASRNVSEQREGIGRHAARFRSDYWCFHGPNMLRTSILTSKDKKPIHTKWHFWWIWRCMTTLMGKRSKQDNISETKAISRKVHFATLLAFCNLKHSESAELCNNLKAEQSCEEISPTTILVATRFSPNKEHQRLT